MHLWTEIRRLALTKQKSKRAICQEYDQHWKTLQKILNHEEPPGYRQRRPRAKPKLDRFLPINRQALHYSSAVHNSAIDVLWSPRENDESAFSRDNRAKQGSSFALTPGRSIEFSVRILS